MRDNIIANFIGRFWSIISNFLFIPLYIRFLGIEGFSIISFSLVITGVIAILDAGLTATLTKEFASKSNDNITRHKVFITLETCYLFITFIVILLFVIFSKTIAYNWLNLENTSPKIVSKYLNIIGIGVAFQLLSNFYIGGFFGIEKQIRANIYQAGMGIVRNGLVVIAIYFNPNLYLFFSWQTLSMIFYVLILRQNLTNHILTEKSRCFFHIEKAILKKVWRFAGGVMLISIVAAVNTQVDKLAISKLLPIQSLGFYTIATSLTQGLIILVNPIAYAVLPRFTSYYSEKKLKEASDLFHKMFLFGSILVLSFAANLILNSEELIWIWTGNHQLASEASPLVPFLATGMVMLSFQILPFNVALANGYTRLNNYIGIISLIITLPGYWIMTKLFGLLGAAIVWCFVQSLITPVFIYFINKRFLNVKKIANILGNEIFLPALTSFFIAIIFSEVTCFDDNRWLLLIWIGLSTLVTLVVTYLVFMWQEFRLAFIKLLNKS